MSDGQTVIRALVICVRGHGAAHAVLAAPLTRARDARRSPPHMPVLRDARAELSGSDRY
jgi:hypothetical protein